MRFAKAMALWCAASFGFTLAMACCGIIIQEEQRKQRAREAELQSQLERRERLLANSGKGLR